MRMDTRWWESDSYTHQQLTPPIDLDDYAGPRGLAYVDVFADGSGRTLPGWGERDFVRNYWRNQFMTARAVVRHKKVQAPFALVMRSMRMVVVDIDGKNGGFDSAERMLLPPTLAETSKSGNGYHLFYTVQDEWDDDKGYAAVPDRIGFREGIDLRGTGCVYHYHHQQWNDRAPVPLPDQILEQLASRTQLVEETRSAIITILNEGDETEVLVMQDNIQSKLTAPIPPGRRNNTLFGIGAEMKTANILGWEKQVHDRALDVGLDPAEADKLIANIRKYG